MDPHMEAFFVLQIGVNLLCQLQKTSLYLYYTVLRSRIRYCIIFINRRNKYAQKLRRQTCDHCCHSGIQTGGETALGSS